MSSRLPPKLLLRLILGLILAVAALLWQAAPPETDTPAWGSRVPGDALSRPPAKNTSVRRQNAWQLLYVIDGDTLIMAGPQGREHVRLIGIDAPELAQEFGWTARSFAAAFLARGSLVLELDQERRDHYGRLLAYVWSGEEMLNKILVARGLALAVNFPPNERYRQILARAQTCARNSRAGFWAQGGLREPPYQFRKRHPWKKRSDWRAGPPGLAVLKPYHAYRPDLSESFCVAVCPAGPGLRSFPRVRVAKALRSMGGDALPHSRPGRGGACAPQPGTHFPASSGSPIWGRKGVWQGFWEKPKASWAAEACMADYLLKSLRKGRRNGCLESAKKA